MAANEPKVTTVVSDPPTSLSAPLLEAADLTRHYAAASRSAATYRAYQSDWVLFDSWCATHDLVSLPATPLTLAMFLSVQAAQGLAPATLTRRLAAIRLKHLAARVPSPHDTVEVLEVMRGIRRDAARDPTKKKAAVSEDLKKMIDAIDVALQVNLDKMSGPEGETFTA